MRYIAFAVTMLMCGNVISGTTSYGRFNRVAYVSNYDGDTITVNIAGEHPLIGDKIKVRVASIDTPEIRGKCDKEKIIAGDTRDYVGRMLNEAKRIDLVHVRRGKYFRIVANVMVDDMSLGQHLIDTGRAVAYNDKKPNWCGNVMYGAQ